MVHEDNDDDDLCVLWQVVYEDSDDDDLCATCRWYLKVVTTGQANGNEDGDDDTACVTGKWYMKMVTMTIPKYVNLTGYETDVTTRASGVSITQFTIIGTIICILLGFSAMLTANAEIKATFAENTELLAWFGSFF